MRTILTVTRPHRNILIILKLCLSGCGGLITKPSDISSPVTEVDNLQVYSKSLKCFWNITAPENKNVVVRLESGNPDFPFRIKNDFQ